MISSLSVVVSLRISKSFFLINKMMGAIPEAQSPVNCNGREKLGNYLTAENMKDSELRMIETEDNVETEGVEERSTNLDSKAESSEELNREENMFEDEEEDKKTSCSLKLHAVKVGLFDVLLYIWDVVSDGLACAKHYLDCHFMWALYTAAFMILPAYAESGGNLGNWYFWMKKDWKFRLPISLICFVLFNALFSPIFFDYFDISATIGLSFLTGLGVAIVTTFVLPHKHLERLRCPDEGKTKQGWHSE